MGKFTTRNIGIPKCFGAWIMVAKKANYVL